PATAVKMVQLYVSRLRRQLAGQGGRLVTRAPGYMLELRDDELDLGRFEAMREEARRAGATGDHERSAGLLRAALELWRGPALADLTFEPFAHNEAERLEELRMGALEAALAQELALGRHADVVGERTGLVARHPF